MKNTSFHRWPVWVAFIVALVAGATTGVLTKLADGSPIPAVSLITNYFGVWVVLLTVIAAWSRSWRRAMLCAVTFMFAMVAAYYVTQMSLFGFFSTQLFLVWAAAALLLAPPFAAIVWHARGTGWASALSAALPIGILLHEAYSVRLLLDREDYPTLFVFDLICAIAFFLLLSKDWKQRGRIIVVLPIVVTVGQVGLDYIRQIIANALYPA